MLFPAKALSVAAFLLSGYGVFAQIPISWSSSFKSDSLKLEVTYNPGNIRITSGGSGKLFTDETANIPAFRLSDDSGIDPSSQYTVAMVDPDSQTLGGNGDTSYIHFLGTNFKIRDPKNPSRELASTKSPNFGYEGPKKTDENHRYIILLFIQKSDIEPEVSSTSRREFSIKDFEKDSGVGELVAGLYFQTAKETRANGEANINRNRIRRRSAKGLYSLV